MKREALLIGKKGVTADSPEVLMQYFIDNIRQLKNDLEELNFLQHSVNIIIICEQIKEINQHMKLVEQKISRNKLAS
jgi:hypothetical protein